LRFYFNGLYNSRLLGIITVITYIIYFFISVSAAALANKSRVLYRLFGGWAVVSYW